MVALGFDGDALEVSCTCPAFGAGPCKHIWATILSAERSGLLNSRRTGPLVDLAADSGLSPAVDRYDDLADEPDPPFDSRARARAGMGAPARRESWRDRLDLAAKTMVTAIAPEPPGSQIVYVVDVPATLAGGVLAVEVARRRQSKAGVWGAPGALRLSPDAIPLLPEPADRELLALLVGAQDSPYRFAGGNAATLYRLHNGLDQLLVPRLCASGRCLLRRDSDSPLSTLAWDPGEPWEFWLEMRAFDGHYAVDGFLRRGALRRALGEPLLIVDRLVFFEGTAARFDHAQSMAILADLRRRGAIKVPRPQALPALERLLRRRDRPRLELDPELRLEESQGVPSPHLIVKASESDWNDRLPCTLSFDYAGTLVPATDSNWCVPKIAERRLLIRDLRVRERGRRTAPAARLPADSEQRRGDRASSSSPPRHLARAVRTLLRRGLARRGRGQGLPSARARPDGGGLRHRLVRPRRATSTSTAPRCRCPRLLAALRRGENTVALGDGTLGMLPEEWLQRYGAARRARARPSRRAIALPPQPGRPARRAARRAARGGRGRSASRARARPCAQFDGIRPAATRPTASSASCATTSAKGSAGCTSSSEFGFGGCLADDMGLGKTVQVLAAARSAPRRRPSAAAPSLVVVPRSLVFNWKQEAARFTPQPARCSSTPAPGARRDAADLRRASTSCSPPTARCGATCCCSGTCEFDYVVLDEAQAIKNAATAVGQGGAAAAGATPPGAHAARRSRTTWASSGASSSS